MLTTMPLVSAAIESSDFTNDFTSLSDVFSSCTILLEGLSVSLAGKYYESSLRFQKPFNKILK